MVDVGEGSNLQISNLLKFKKQPCNTPPVIILLCGQSMLYKALDLGHLDVFLAG